MANGAERILKVAFVGSSRFGLRCLAEIAALDCCQVVGVVSNPEVFTISYRPEGVTNVLHADFRPLVEERSLPYLLVNGALNDEMTLATLRGWAPDLVVVVGWYHMVPRSVRRIAPAIGLHASLLPQYRGGAPLVWAMINGEQKTGISLFYLEDGVDTGDLLGQAETSILFDDTIATLYARIEELGLDLLRRHLPAIAAGTHRRIPQDLTKGSVVPQRSPADARIDWSRNSLDLYNFVRAQTKPYPGAFALWQGRSLKIWEARSVRASSAFEHPGTVVSVEDGGIEVCCGGGAESLLLTSVGFDGDSPQAASTFARSNVLQPLARFE